MIWLQTETVSIILFFIGFYSLAAQREILKSIMAVGVMQIAAILYFLGADFDPGSVPPIGDIGSDQMMADPLPQALMITDIVIGIGVTAVSLTLMIHLYHRYGTSNWLTARQLRNKS